MRNSHIKIFHKKKDVKTNTVCHTLVFSGGCVVFERLSCREQMGGAENNSEILAIIYPDSDFEIECGDRCEFEGRKLTVRKVSKLLDGVSEGFKHIRLSLR